jgi:transcriptional regulator with XRE-family HTH domain
MHKLTTLRKARGWSQRQLADQVPCSQSSIDRYERRESIPGRWRLAKLVGIFEGELAAADFYEPPAAPTTESAEVGA